MSVVRPGDRATAMRRFSEELFQALRPTLVPDPRRPGWPERYLREACEAAIARLAADPRSLPMVARGLFNGSRSLVRAHDQLRAAKIIEHHVKRARSFFTAERGATGAAGGPPRCAALNRKGKPCGREPIWGTPYCVSHTPKPVRAA